MMHAVTLRLYPLQACTCTLFHKLCCEIIDSLSLSHTYPVFGQTTLALTCKSMSYIEVHILWYLHIRGL